MQFCSQSFWAKLYLYGRSFIQTEIFTYYASLKQVWFVCMGMFKPCANCVGMTVISAPVSSKKIYLFLLLRYLSQKIIWSLCWITGEGSYSQPQQFVFFLVLLCS